MNYDQARERKGSDGNGFGLWDWTSMNDGQIRIATPCTNKCFHHTKEDAEKHFYLYCLEMVQEFEIQEAQYCCEVCGDWTSKGLENRNFRLINFYTILCDKHRTISELEKLHPFKPDIRLIHS